MDQERRDFWAHYVRMLANRMELRDWTVGIVAAPCEDGANASVDREANHKYAGIKLCFGFDQRAAEDQRLTLVHELIHCHFTAQDTLMAVIRADKGHKGWVGLMCATLSTEDERSVSTLANILAPSFPLPGEYEDEEPGNAGPRSKPIAPPTKKRKQKAAVTA